MKENINDFLLSATELLKGVKIVSFNYKKDESKAYHVGFIADDTDKILAGKMHDRMEMSNCIGVLIKAVQELNERIKLLEEK